MKILIFLLLSTACLAQTPIRGYLSADTLPNPSVDTSYFYGDVSGGDQYYQVWFTFVADSEDTLYVEQKVRISTTDSVWIKMMVYNPYKSELPDTAIYIDRIANGKTYTQCLLWQPFVGGSAENIFRLIRQNPGGTRVNSITYIIYRRRW